MLPLPLSLGNSPGMYEAALTMLMHELLLKGARQKVVMALTGMTDKRVRAASKAMATGEEKRGPCQLPEPKGLVGMGYRRNHNANLHSTRYITLYKELEQKFNEPMHEGFLLLATYHCYEESLAAHHIAPSQEQLDLNRAYALLRAYQTKEIVLERCGSCEAPFVKLNWFQVDSEACPICAKAAHKRRLPETGKKGGRIPKAENAA